MNDDESTEETTMTEAQDAPETFTGTVIFFKNYGFIDWSRNGVKQKDLFCHFSDLISDSGYRTLHPGQKVSFQLGLNHSGKPKGTHIIVIEDNKPVKSA